MSFDKNEVLDSFIKSGYLNSELKENGVQKRVSFLTDSENIEIESLKTLIASLSQEDSELIILRKINNKIKELS